MGKRKSSSFGREVYINILSTLRHEMGFLHIQDQLFLVRPLFDIVACFDITNLRASSGGVAQSRSTLALSPRVLKSLATHRDLTSSPIAMSTHFVEIGDFPDLVQHSSTVAKANP